jgi:hypothetical protein
MKRLVCAATLALVLAGFCGAQAEERLKEGWVPLELKVKWLQRDVERLQCELQWQRFCHEWTVKLSSRGMPPWLADAFTRFIRDVLD